MEFKQFANFVNARLHQMLKTNNVYIVQIDKDKYAAKYLEFFPKGSDPIFVTNTVHNCDTCKAFIRRAGLIVTINDDLSLNTIWDDYENMPYPYNLVGQNMSEYIKAQNVENVFLHYEELIGKKENIQTHSCGNLLKTPIKREHFWITLPSTYISSNVNGIRSESEARVAAVKRLITEIDQNDIMEVIEEIKLGNLAESFHHLNSVKELLVLQGKYFNIPNNKRYIFLWKYYKKAYIRSSNVTKLLKDLTSSINSADRDKAYSDYRVNTSAENYNQSTTDASVGLIKQFRVTLNENNLEPSLHRKLMPITELNINDCIWKSKTVDKAKATGINAILDELTPASVSVDNIKGKPISYEEFTKLFSSNCVPIKSIDILYSDKLLNNRMALTTAIHKDSEPLFLWGQEGWTYEAGYSKPSAYAQSVKKAGGATIRRKDGEVLHRISLLAIKTDGMDTGDDFDIHLHEPYKTHIYHGNNGTIHDSTGMLDVDWNANGKSRKTDLVENITYTNNNLMSVGHYKIIIDNYKSTTGNNGFVIEIVTNGQTHLYKYNKPFNKRSKQMLTLYFDGNEFKVTTVNPQLTKVDDTGLTEQTNIKGEWKPVSALMLSPNWWVDNDIGHGEPHLLMTMNGMEIKKDIIGFHADHLKGELHKYRKVLNALRNDFKCSKDDPYLSGLGFPLHTTANVTVKVTNEDNTSKVYQIQINKKEK